MNNNQPHQNETVESLDLQQQLQQLQQERQSLQSQLRQAQATSELTAALTKAGVTDLEVALLLARQRLPQNPQDAPGLAEIIKALRTERPTLFADDPAPLTAGARTRATATASGAMLQQLADRARRTGSRQDLQTYLQYRRRLKS